MGNTDPSKNRGILRTGQPDRADDRMIFIPSAENHCTCIIITYVVEFCFYSSSVVDLKLNVKVISFTTQLLKHSRSNSFNLFFTIEWVIVV